jgi:hypothetical protein
MVEEGRPSRKYGAEAVTEIRELFGLFAHNFTVQTKPSTVERRITGKSGPLPNGDDANLYWLAAGRHGF